MTQVRAVETGLPLVRAANTGISGVIDARGRVVDALALNAHGTLDATVRLAAPDPIWPFPARTVGLAILAFFLIASIAMRIRQRLGSN